jgi:hypothetical protein
MRTSTDGGSGWKETTAETLVRSKTNLARIDAFIADADAGPAEGS